MITDDSENSKRPKEYYSREIQDRKINGEGTRKVSREILHSAELSPPGCKAART